MREAVTNCEQIFLLSPLLMRDGLEGGQSVILRVKSCISTSTPKTPVVTCGSISIPQNSWTLCRVPDNERTSSTPPVGSVTCLPQGTITIVARNSTDPHRFSLMPSGSSIRQLACAVRAERVRRSGLSCAVVIVALGPRAAENLRATRRQIRLQAFPRHERDILTLGIGTDGIRRRMKCQAGTLVGFG
jgi:hypothetical protein